MFTYANTVFVVHFLLVLMNVVGWIFPGPIFYAYLTTWFLAVAVDILFGVCPLTQMEFNIRKKLDPEAKFEKSCMVHYIRKWRGLAPRSPESDAPKTWRQKHSIVFIMVPLLVVSLIWQTLVYGRDIFYFA
ncbi:MAG: hypothetical protein COV34_00400 [Candidatus Zambryskibacteria bacterium CG10_big_fil_rev_8_21_14_0_10_42_12]|uniref:DUF2784 domain-containing protein n=1 Tax=Candidatus Zambryskibacteria bacterium CG10_big_fil_rev_8_21_14_0_10_42_12 TaxID=1975115 RepID=A0A2H0QYQ6_9BACT|nr:MAG: hypothetical protein COV34_00400 [Candidatus Zambryskibacteria bacterium CG10_big_fil_rev_8_21_14_0_10_42_12]